jgi:hypothetical protein
MIVSGFMLLTWKSARAENREGTFFGEDSIREEGEKLMNYKGC